MDTFDEADDQQQRGEGLTPLPVGACLFCERSFAGQQDSADRVLRHMSDKHQFTLPHADKHGRRRSRPRRSGGRGGGKRTRWGVPESRVAAPYSEGGRGTLLSVL